MSQRRNFLKGFGLLGAVIAGYNAPTVMAKEPETLPLVDTTPKVDPQIIAQIEKINPSTLSLTQTYGEIAPPPPPSTYNGMYTISGGNIVQERMRIDSDGSITMLMHGKNFVPGTEKQVDVKLVPGPDGELYLNINGQWKKVLTV